VRVALTLLGVYLAYNAVAAVVLIAWLWLSRDDPASATEGRDE
jgi:hypothetical protein